MRILNTPAPAVPPTGGSPQLGTPAFDVERVSALERVVQSFREKIRDLEERLHVFEAAPKATEPAFKPATTPAPAPRPTRSPLPEVALDAEAFKKNLLPKMWKYLNDDERPAKTI